MQLTIDGHGLEDTNVPCADEGIFQTDVSVLMLKIKQSLKLRGLFWEKYFFLNFYETNYIWGKTLKNYCTQLLQ